MNSSIFNKRYPMYGKVKIVHDAYNFVSHKSIRQYYVDKHYKRMIDHLYDTLNYPPSVNAYRAIAPYIDSLTHKQFKVLVQLAKEGKLDAVCNLMKIASKV